MTALENADGADLAARSATIAAALTRWLCGGAIQNADGSYSGWRNADGTLSPPYPEITGYMLTFLAQESLDGAERRRADAAARWLAERVEREVYTCRLDREDGVYLFDVGMITHGLFAYGRRRADQRLLDAGRASAEFLIERLVRGGVPRTMADDPRLAGRQATWSTAGNAHLLKVLQALMSADQHGVAGAADTAEQVISWGLLQPHGRAPIETCPGTDQVSLHAACYAAEGFWIWAAARGRPEAGARATRIVEWVWQQQLPSGGFTAYALRSGGAVADRHQSDVLAQAIRLAVLLDMRPAGLMAAINVLEQSLAVHDGQAAVLYRPQIEWPHSNCWSSLFACQAMRLLDGRSELAWYELA